MVAVDGNSVWPEYGWRARLIIAGSQVQILPIHLPPLFFTLETNAMKIKRVEVSTKLGVFSWDVKINDDKVRFDSTPAFPRGEEYCERIHFLLGQQAYIQTLFAHTDGILLGMSAAFLAILQREQDLALTFEEELTDEELESLDEDEVINALKTAADFLYGNLQESMEACRQSSGNALDIHQKKR
jgi:hypothetical protein